MVTGIVVMADYLADPVWAEESNGRPGPMLPLDRLPVSDQLRSDLRAWAAEFDALSETDDEWPDEDRRREWIGAGRLLADRLARELGSEFRVRYRHDPQ